MKISIVGAGKVGSAAAFSILHNLDAGEIALVDIMKELAEGEALDLSHAAVGLGKNIKISGGDDFSQTRGSDFVVITAGRARKQGETREQLFDFNKKIVEGVCEKLKNFCPDAAFIVVTNPSSEITEVVRKFFSKVVGMENQLDTARAKFYIAREISANPADVKSFVAGGHGEQMSVNFLENLSAGQREKITEEIRNAGSDIIAKKGYTCWGVAAQISNAIRDISRKEK